MKHPPGSDSPGMPCTHCGGAPLGLAQVLYWEMVYQLWSLRMLAALAGAEYPEAGVTAAGIFAAGVVRMATAPPGG